ncbi:MAG TPA: hypothetical protein VII68_18570 [Casimicrobiaceae bacterium]
MPQKKPKKPKHHQQHKPKKKKKLKHHGHGHRKPDPDKPRRKRGKKPQKPIRKPKRPTRSGSIPRPCRRLLGEAKLLDCWLAQNPKIANAIVWEPTSGDEVAWPAWSPHMKAALREAWMDARAWHAAGMSHYGGTVVADPPPNQDVPPESGPFRTVLDGPTQAWPLYLAIVAQSLAAEIEGWVPWSLRGYADDALPHLLSGVKMFTRDTDDGGQNDSDHPGGYVLRGPDNMERCTPSHPTYVYKFLIDNDLVDNTPRATIGRVLDWCRANLSHFQGQFTPQVAENHWQYRGYPPVRRIIEGTSLLNPQNPGSVPPPQHWTAGCWGTSAFLRSVLRSVNIPVTLVWRGSHTMPHFLGNGRYLSHGDDPYNAFAHADYPAEQLLIGQVTFEGWFPFDPQASEAQQTADDATSSLHVGRRVYDLAVWHFSDALLNYYCQDKASGASHANGVVFEKFASHGITLAQLEATQFWQRLDAEAAFRGIC